MSKWLNFTILLVFSVQGIANFLGHFCSLHSTDPRKLLSKMFFSSHIGMERITCAAEDRPGSIRIHGDFSASSMLDPVQIELSERTHRSGDEPRDLVHAALPSTWRRSSLSSANTLVPEDFCQKETDFLSRGGQIKEASLPLSLAPLLKSHMELYRTGLSYPEIIDVRKNPF